MSRRVTFVVPAEARETMCSSCGAPIAWIVTGGGKRMPISLRTVVVNLAGEREGESHFADCPNAAEHRRARA